MIARVALHQDIKDKPKLDSNVKKAFNITDSALYFRLDKQDPALGGSCLESRDYFIGAFPVGHVLVYSEGGHPRGCYVAHMRDPSKGNGGVGFPTEDKLHDWIWDQLRQKP